MTDAPSWERLRAAFSAALDVPAAQRESWLRAQYADDAPLLAELRRLLAAHAGAASVLDAGASQFVASLIHEDAPDDARIGNHFGAYRLLRLLGAGGMGSVYLAERTDGQFRHRVALKLIHDDLPSAALRERFLRERDILARLQHAAIATLLDGGVSDNGTPYFTLELIDGDTITRWCDARGATLAERARLLLKVCEAVQYAHRNLVVHRDLKPSNILVTAQGEPKLLDFGIAKLLDDEAAGAEALTGTQTRPMTREYAAPEQVLAQPITTATDVYALGVLLYELFCGRLPYRSAAIGGTSWPMAIVEETPETLSRALLRDPADVAELARRRGVSAKALQRGLRGDPERIVRRALEKSPDARYAAVADLADDLLAWLEHRPVSGGGWRYRARKFLRRHWLPIGAAAALGFALIAGGIGVVWQARATAREARSTAEVKEFLLNLFNAVDPHEAKGQDIRARELIDRGAQRIEHELADQPALKGELQGVLGRIYYRLGLYKQALALQQQAIDGLTRDGSRALLLARTRTDFAATLTDLGDFDAAAAATASATREFEALDAAPGDRVGVLIEASRNEVSRHRFEASARLAKQALELARAARVDSALLGRTLLSAGNAEWGTRAFDAAEAHYREALALQPAEGGDEVQVMKLRTNLAMVLRGQSRFEEARAMTEQQLAITRKLFGADHPNALRAQRDLGLTLYHLGRYGEARAQLDAGIAGQRKQLGPDNPELAGSLINLGLVLADSGDLAGAENAFGEARDIWLKRYGPDYAGMTTALGDLGYVHLLQRRLDQADAELTQARALQQKQGTAENAWDLYRLGEVRRLRGDVTAAVDLDRAALAQARQEGGEANRFTALAHSYLGLALRDGGDEAAASDELRASLASFAGYLPKARHPLADGVRLELASMLAHADATRAEAGRLIREACADRREFFGADDARTRAACAAAKAP